MPPVAAPPRDPAPSRRPKLVSPSRIARYYYLECERYLRYTSTPREDWTAEGIPPRDIDTSPVTAAILESGYVWEEQVVERLGKRLVLSDRPRAGPVRDRILGVEDTRTAVQRLEPGQLIYQPTLVPSPAFYARYGIDRAFVAFTDTRPDLIEAFTDADGRLRLRVIDVKASPRSKLSHRIQAALYTLILRDLLLDWGIGDRAISDDGGVWLVNADEPETFDLRGILPPLETFLEKELAPLMARPAADARWHVWFRCEWCPYFEHCRDQMRSTDDVSRLPYLTVPAKRYLNGLNPPVRTIADFEALLADPARLPLLDDAASLRNKPDRLAAQVRALRTGEVQFHGGNSLAMPKGEHVRIVLTLQAEPVSGQVYTWGIYAQGLRDVIGESPVLRTETAPTPDVAAWAELERSFVRELHALLFAVDRFNRDRDWSAQKTLQAFVYDTYERAVLTELLVRGINDEAVAEQALQLFFHFQRPELVDAPKQPATEVFFPLVVIASVLRSLTALPVETTYRFADAVRLLPGSRPFEYRESDFFGFPLSNQLRSDAIFHAWHRGRTEFFEGIAKRIRQRLWATNSLVNGLREAVAGDGTLFAWPPRFALPAAERFRHEILSRLAFIARYEAVVSYLDLRTARMGPLKERLSDGTTLALTYQGDDLYTIDDGIEDVDIDDDPFPKWLLSEATDEGHRSMLAYDDFQYRNRKWISDRLALALAEVTGQEVRADGRPKGIRLKLTASPAFGSPQRGRRYHLDKRFTDFNTASALEELHAEDGAERSAVAHLVQSPASFASPLNLPPKVRDHAYGLGLAHGMTPSQCAAFAGILDRRLQLVWGPPGTGKTHFLALAILCLAEAHRPAGLELRTLVTAFTHAAIDNLLRKIVELDQDLRVVRGGLKVGKLDRKTLEGMDAIDLIYPQAGWDGSPAVAVIGGTVWKVRKGMDPGSADLVVVDEGSQVKLPEAVVGVRRLRETGRLVVAGDDRQLPPIVKGAYPDTAESPPLHRSVFEVLRAGGAPTATLLENWRSNHTLVRYPAAQVYVPDYLPANEEIGQRRIRLAPHRTGLLPAGSHDLGITRELIEAMLDPDAPLVVGVLEGVRATAANRVEAGLVGALALELRERLVSRDGRRYPGGRDGDRAFWTEGLFIVSPHHAQIRAIHRHLRAGRPWEYRPFVDTVDKMQGQEADAVIVSYGVSDVEFAMAEKEFIYSLNRLNVSITRGRAKTMVFLPRPLVEPPIQAFEDDRIADGVAFMQGLVRYAEREGRTIAFGLTNASRLVASFVR